MKILIRKVKDSDHPFIYATYLRNRWFDKSNKTTLKRSTWSSLQHKRLEELLDNQLAIVACLEEDVDTILGYSLLEGTTPFTYIKLAWRSPELQLIKRLEGKK